MISKKHYRTLLFVGALGCAIASALIVSSRGTNAHANAAAAPATNLPDAPPLPEAEPASAPGLALTFYRPGENADDANAGDTRVSRMAALYVPAGSVPSSFFASGPFVAIWRGDLNMRLRDTYTFSAEGRGKLTVTINDAVALEAVGEDFTKIAGAEVRLNKGKNKLLIRYELPVDGDAQMRLFWTVKGERMSSAVPPMVLTHDTAAPGVRNGMRVREGRMLMAEMRCTNCHATPFTAEAKPIPPSPAEAIKPGAMPELAISAPALDDIGARLNRDWMAVWIDNPKSLRPTAHMPRVFHGAAADAKTPDQRAVDAAAYLASLGGKPDPDAAAPAEPENEQIEAGGKLFTHLNCIACHTPPNHDPQNQPPVPEGEPAPKERVPLRFVKAKFKPEALKAFLLNPQAHYAWNPMPNFKMTDVEAASVAAFLLGTASGELPIEGELAAGDPARGKKLVMEAGCVQCHPMKDATSALKVAALNDIPKAGWTRGCMSSEAVADRKAPLYAMTDGQRDALLAFAATDRTSLGRENAVEFAQRQMTSMNCANCHARDGEESLLATTFDMEQKELESTYPADAGGAEGNEAFAPDQRPPLLTWAGEKLQPQWTAQFLAGQVPYKPRPYLHARMPAFPARAGLVAAGLAMEHGCAPTNPPPEKPNAELAAIGSKLAGKTPNEAFSCTQCHAVAKQPPFAPFEAPAVNFAYAADRLRKDYYHRWIHNPLRLDPNTKMPAFEREDGTTPITTVLEGDARKQFEAVWQYLLAGQKIQPPAE